MMENYEKNAPEIRFPGFIDPWEQRKLGDLSSSFDYGLNAAAKDFDGTNKYIRITDIDDDSRCFIQENVTSPNTDLSEAEKYKLVSGDILFARTGASVGKTYIYRPSDGLVFYAGFLIRARIKSDYNPEFVFQNTLTSRYSKFIALTSMRSGQPGINAQEYSQYEIMMPSRAEQDKISEYLNGIDNLITLHQRKCDELRIYKKGLLQHMFPQPGESFPRVRFPEFTAPWEQCKLGELYSERNEKGNDTLQILSVSIHSGVSDGELDAEGLGKNVRRSEDKTKYKRVYPGDLIFNMMRAWQGAIGVAKNEGMISPAYISAIPSREVFPLFMDYSLRRKESISQINDLSYGVTDFRKRLYWGSFIQVDCALPSVEEQQKIWSFLNDIDNAITLHQQKCNELKVFKKGMLQKMFV